MELLESGDGSPLTVETLKVALINLLDIDEDSFSIENMQIVEGTEKKQPCAHTGVLRLNVKGLPNSVYDIFLKKVTVKAMGHKAWHDRRRTLVYARTEARFYSEFSPILVARGVKMPRIAKIESNVDVVLGDSEVSGPVGQEPDPSVLNQTSCFMFISCASGDKFLQDSPLSEKRAEQALQAVARLHAAAWEDQELLNNAAERLQRHGGSYNLRIRNPAELEKIGASWERFMNMFGSLKPKLFERPEIQRFGERLQNIAPLVAERLNPIPSTPLATLIHGDFKAMNVFLPIDGTNKTDALLIDFASTGLGYGMSDVAMHLSHSVSPDILENGGEERLIMFYLQSLHASLAERHQNSTEGVQPIIYPKSDAFYHYKLGVVDYARFVVGRFWASASPETFASKAGNPNVTFPNRNVDAAFSFIERANRCLEDLEKDMP